jgi:sec-independent protein translocase protein TatA
MIGRGFEVLILALLVIGLFGWKRLPGAVRDLGRSARILKAETRAMRDNLPLPAERLVRADPNDVVLRRVDEP